MEGEPYRRGRPYDLVWFLNVTEELRIIKGHTDTKTLVVGMEPLFMYPPNYDADLLRLSDRYMGYRNFADPGYAGTFERFTFPVYPRDRVRAEFPLSLKAERDHDFCIFATHDPNIRRALGDAAGAHRSILAGPLFENRVPDKLSVQRRCRFGLISENDINDYYFSEKLGDSLAAGCVPVYYGCTRIKERLPPELFIDMSDFPGADGSPDIKRVIEHCLSPGVYETHFQAIAAGALELLAEDLSTETCLIEPVQQFVDDLNASGWRSTRGSWQWRYWRCRTAIGRVLKKT